MADLPSWLQSTPTDSRDSLLGGFKMGAEFAQLKQERQKFQADQALAVMDMQQKKQESDRRFQLDVGATAVDAQIKKQELDQKAIEWAQKSQADLRFQSEMQRLTTGPDAMPYEQAYLQASMLTGANKPDLAAHFGAVSRENVAQIGADSREKIAGDKADSLTDADFRKAAELDLAVPGDGQKYLDSINKFKGKGTDGTDSAKPATERYKIITGGGGGAAAPAAAPASIPPAEAPAAQLPAEMSDIAPPTEPPKKARAAPQDAYGTLNKVDQTHIKQLRESLKNLPRHSAEYRDAYDELMELYSRGK